MTASNFKIEKGIELPPRRDALAYPYLDMRVGDSFKVSCDDTERQAVQKRVSNSAYKFGRRNRVSFTTRMVEGGVRCWRVK